MQPRRVLHIEDDPQLRDVVMRMLVIAGYQVQSIADGLEALKRLGDASERCDALILDLVLPWLNGLDLLAQLRSDAATARLPVLVTTGAMITPHQFADDPFVAVLAKPFTPKQLTVALESLLYRKTSLISLPRG